MGTTLELAREIRDHIVNHSTGRLNVTFADTIQAIDFSEGTIVTGREELFRSLDEPPVAFEFQKIDIPKADELQSGAALLVEALDSIDDAALGRIWEAYRDWTLLLSQDPDIHRTKVSEHLSRNSGRLHRLLKLAVTGAVSLEPPEKRSIQDEMDAIRTATSRDNYWEALGIDRTAAREEVKRAYRELARQFHPDRWHATKEVVLRDRIEQAFRDVQYCYEKALKAVPLQLGAPTPIRPESVPRATGPVRTTQPDQRMPYQQPPTPATGPEPHTRKSPVVNYGEVSEVTTLQKDTLFRRIFDKFFKAA